MAALLRKRKGKAVATTSEAPRFKTLYHESHYNNFFCSKRVREFYANAWRLEEHKNQPPTYSTQIRGIQINFSIESIHRVLKLRDTPLPNAASYHDRKANNNLRLDEVLACLYVEGAH
ncbi:hypothetical protein PIB30_087325 [Stylosanthes scabra]|uniref:Uncharacterized protein n=1 Tax=Stylosanthes scabra TaxID=79078 RepID=A0ABU6ZRZ4_9FABA|nr:hypothetical protein [Stylosanthes scabra]